MTVDRAIQILDPEHREHYESIEPVNEACRMGMEALKRTQWISVNDKLPEYGQYVLLIAHGWNTEYGDIYIGCLKTVKADDGSGNIWGIVRPECEWTIAGWSYFRIPIVTRWMPMPEPPKEE